MKIHTFIFTWLDYYKNAKKYENILTPISDTVTVINSNIDICSDFPEWVHLNDAYFTEQWYTALKMFNQNCDIFFHIQADIEFDNFDNLIHKAKYAFQKYNCGIYTPNINYTAWVYPTLSNLKCYEQNIYEVPITDTTCWFIRNNILQSFPKINFSINKHGWFVDFVCTLLSRNNNMPVLRDYSFEIKHPKHTGYSHEIARMEYNNTKLCLGDSWNNNIENLMQEAVSYTRP
jgi:hypothetical protein